jgi:cell division protein YceG involved in septum cleavage
MIHSQTTTPKLSYQMQTCRSENRGPRPSLKAIVYLVCFVLWLLASTAGVTYAYHHQDIHTGPTTTYRVQQGDTLYSIVSNLGLDKHESTGKAAFELQQLNHIDAMIQPGEVIRVPVGR